ncbi:MAG: lysylphosphatidylglycerol synthase transmembrane domain-containing protein [Candidatus Peregrinibacteria bacterium]
MIRRSVSAHISGYLLKSIGVVLFVWILLRIDRVQLLFALHNASLPLILTGLGLLAPIYVLRSMRWHSLTTGSGVDESLLEATHLYLASLFLGVVTPGKVGEAMRIPSLMRKGLTGRKSTALTILDRGLDIALLGPLGLASVAFLSGTYPFLWWTGLAIACGGGAYVLYRTTERWLTLPSDMVSLLKKTWMPVLGFTIVSWSLYYLQLIIFMRAFALEIPMIPFLSIMTVVGILSVLPIAPAGLGTREAALLYFFRTFAIPPPLTIAFAFTIFITTFAGSLIGAYCLWRLPTGHAHRHIAREPERVQSPHA